MRRLCCSINNPLSQSFYPSPNRGHRQAGARRRPGRTAGTGQKQGAVRMIVVSAREQAPARRPLVRMLLTTEGQGDLDAARTTLRWRIERFLFAPKVGTRIEVRRLDYPDGLG